MSANETHAGAASGRPLAMDPLRVPTRKSPDRLRNESAGADNPGRQTRDRVNSSWPDHPPRAVCRSSLVVRRGGSSGCPPVTSTVATVRALARPSRIGRALGPRPRAGRPRASEDTGARVATPAPSTAGLFPSAVSARENDETFRKNQNFSPLKWFSLPLSWLSRRHR